MAVYVVMLDAHPLPAVVMATYRKEEDAERHIEFATHADWYRVCECEIWDEFDEARFTTQRWLRAEFSPFSGAKR